jgi:hypothetical protein
MMRYWLAAINRQCDQWLSPDCLTNLATEGATSDGLLTVSVSVVAIVVCVQGISVVAVLLAFCLLGSFF